MRRDLLCCMWRRWCSGRRACCTVGPAALCARGRRPARSPALLCPARSPAAAWPARPLAVRAASFARRVGSKPGQAPQAPRRPPIGRCLSLVCCWLVSATAHGHRSQARWFSRRPPHQWGRVADVWLARCPDVQLWLSISNFARNSSMTHSNIAFVSLELQRFWGILKNDRDKLCARFGWRRCRRRPRAPQQARWFSRRPTHGGLAAVASRIVV